MDEPLRVMRNGTPLRRAGVVGHRGLSSRNCETLHDLEVTSPVATWADLAALPSLTTEDLVIAGDAFATRDAGLLAPMVEAPTSANPCSDASSPTSPTSRTDPKSQLSGDDSHREPKSWDFGM